MFSKIAEFFINNSKLTFVLVIISFITGIGSYLILPKQYNPEIIVPAFNIIIEAPGLDASETKNLIVSPMEDKIMELEGIDEVYGVAGDNMAGVMAKFEVGVDKEKAKIRLYQKIDQSMDLKPLGVSNPIIQAIDPDELPQITFAIYSDSSDIVSTEEKYIYLRQIANILKETIKTVPNTTTIDIVGGYRKNIIVELDLEAIQARQVDILQVYDIIKKNNLSTPIGNIGNSGENNLIEINGKIEDINSLKKLIISDKGDFPVYLSDVADIRYGISDFKYSSSFFSENNLDENSKEAVFIGIGKKIGSNAVFVTNDIKNKIEEIKQKLPKDINIEIIQDEGETAKQATDMLITNLIQSIVIVFIVLSLSLGIKNALNTAISIPLTLFTVFTLSLVMGENINRITLFALILVLGMLVDDSTVVVENMNRHLKQIHKTGKTKLEAITDAIKEVQVGVVLSTVTRLLAFGAMFAVGGMMGEYMGPIPKFALMASVISTMVALSINPWITYNITNVDKLIEKLKKKKPSKFDIRKPYIKFLKRYIGTDKKINKRRKRFKFVFWILLFAVMIAPIYAGVFKARMLPKSNQDQIYLWIDGPRGWTVENMQDVEKDVEMFLRNISTGKGDIPNIVKNISSTIGTPFMPDFANMFRGGMDRTGENELSARINLISSSEYEKLIGQKRISSENFVIELRPLLRDYLLSRYPDIDIKLLEDPPGPPVRSTFLAMIKGGGDYQSKELFAKKIENEIYKLGSNLGLEDIGNTFGSTYKKYEIIIDHESLSRALLDVEQVSQTLAIAVSGIDVSLRKDINSLEETNIILSIPKKDKNTLSLLDRITFTNKNGEIIYLKSIADIKNTFVSSNINTDNREESINIFAEMGDNSLVYPTIKLYSILTSSEFLGEEYIVKKVSPYYIEYIGQKDGNIYKLEWSGEWKLTMDTFRDLGLAMAIALLLIYFLLVGQFSSFKIAGIIMITFLLGFYGVFPIFSILYLVQNEYFSATAMIGVIALAGIVVGNAIILIEYISNLKSRGLTIETAVVEAGYVRFAPILLTSLTTILGASTIIGDPVWSGLARAIIGGLFVSSILTLIVIPIFYYDSQKESRDKCMKMDNMKDC